MKKDPEKVATTVERVIKLFPEKRDALLQWARLYFYLKCDDVLKGRK